MCGGGAENNARPRPPPPLAPRYRRSPAGSLSSLAGASGRSPSPKYLEVGVGGASHAVPRGPGLPRLSAGLHTRTLPTPLRPPRHARARAAREAQGGGPRHKEPGKAGRRWEALKARPCPSRWNLLLLPRRTTGSFWKAARLLTASTLDSVQAVPYLS